MKDLMKLYRIQWRWKALQWHMSLPVRQIINAVGLLALASLYPLYFIYTFLLEPLKVYFMHKEESQKIIKQWETLRESKP